MPVQRTNPSTLAAPGGYSHVVKDGNTVYIAGQVARGTDGKTVGVGDIRAQAEQVFKNLQAALGSVGGTMDNVVKLNTFMTHREDIPGYRDVRTRYMNNQHLPASTLILCAGLADPDFRIEVEVIAVVP